MAPLDLTRDPARLVRFPREVEVDLSLVIPARNERENLELLLPALRGVLSSLGIRSEIIIADGASTDGTAEAAQRWGAKVVDEGTRGYGNALLAGFSASTGSYIATMDADLSHRPSILEQLWSRRADAEVLVASRYVTGGRAEMGLFRRALSLILNRVYGRLLSLPLHDLSSGFRLYRRSVLDGILLRAHDFDALEEILIRIYCDGWRVKEVPFRYHPRGSGRSHVKLIRFAFAYLRTLGRMWRLRNSVASADYDFRAFDSPIWLQRYWQRTRHRIVLSYLERSRQILDIGCGSSRIILDLPQAVGLDISEGRLRWLRPRHSQVVRATLEQLPFADNTFDAVINSEVLEHVPDRFQNFAEMSRVLRPGGTVVVGTPDYGRRTWRVLERVHHWLMPEGYADDHITHYTRGELELRMRQAGFEPLDCQYVGHGEMIFKARKPCAADA